ELIGDDVEPLLAAGGEGLSGLEVLTGRIASKELGRPVYPRLDAEGFRAHQRESLEELALASAEEAKRTRRPQLLPPLSPAEPRRAYLVTFVDVAGEVLDRGIATFFAAPSSATGEDAAELSVHGSPVVAGLMLAALVRAGARLARPGEFTERAFLLGKLDLVEAESVKDLIEARTEAAARLSARRLEGRLSRSLAQVRDDLLGAAAALAATIDFAEDVGETVSAGTLAKLESAVA